MAYLNQIRRQLNPDTGYAAQEQAALKAQETDNGDFYTNFSRLGSDFSYAGESDNLFRDLIKNYGRLASRGVYGEKGISDIQSKMTAARNLRMAAIRNGLRQKLGRRLGPRSGAVDMALINAIYPQAIADEQGTLADLTSRNYESKLQGLSGQQDILGLLSGVKSQQDQLNAQKKANKFGWGDALGIVGQGIGLATSGVFGGGEKPKVRV